MCPPGKTHKQLSLPAQPGRRPTFRGSARAAALSGCQSALPLSALSRHELARILLQGVRTGRWLGYNFSITTNPRPFLPVDGSSPKGPNRFAAGAKPMVHAGCKVEVDESDGHLCGLRTWKPAITALGPLLFQSFYKWTPPHRPPACVKNAVVSPLPLPGCPKDRLPHPTWAHFEPAFTAVRLAGRQCPHGTSTPGHSGGIGKGRRAAGAELGYGERMHRRSRPKGLLWGSGSTRPAVATAP